MTAPAEAAVDAAIALFGLQVRPEWRAIAVRDFTAIAAAAQLVTDFPLDQEAEYGPVFEP